MNLTKSLMIVSSLTLTSCISPNAYQPSAYPQATYQPASYQPMEKFPTGNWSMPTKQEAPSYSVTPNAYGTGYNVTPY